MYMGIRSVIYVVLLLVCFILWEALTSFVCAWVLVLPFFQSNHLLHL